MRQVRSCGVLLVRGREGRVEEVLLMRHPTRWDIPKGHIEPWETDRQCALREMHEETGVAPEDVKLEDDFRFELHYQVHYDKKAYEKTLVVFLGRLLRDVEIVPTEHPGYEWIAWNPPHHIQEQTIDPLLAALERHLEGE